MADYPKFLEDQEDNKETREAKGVYDVIRRLIDSGKMPEMGSSEYTSGKVEPSAIQPDDLAQFATGGAAFLAKPIAALAGKALTAKVSAPMIPAIGQVLSRSKIAQILKDFKPAGEGISEAGSAVLNELKKNSVLAKMLREAPTGTSPLDLSQDLMGHAVLESTGNEETIEGAKKAAEALYPEAREKATVLEGPLPEVQKQLKEKFGYLGSVRPSWDGFASANKQNLENPYIGLISPENKSPTDVASIYSHELQHIQDLLSKGDSLRSRPYKFNLGPNNLNLKNVSPESAQSFYDNVNSFTYPFQRLGLRPVKDQKTLKDLYNFLDRLPAEQKDVFLNTISGEFSQSLSTAQQQNPYNLLKQVTKNHHADSYPNNYETDKGFELLGLTKPQADTAVNDTVEATKVTDTPTTNSSGGTTAGVVGAGLALPTLKAYLNQDKSSEDNEDDDLND